MVSRVLAKDSSDRRGRQQHDVSAGEQRAEKPSVLATSAKVRVKEGARPGASLDSSGSPSSPTTMSAGETQSSLRQRRKSSAESIKTDTTVDDFHKTRKDEEVVWGKTPAGEVFRVPTTHDVLTALFHPAYPKSHLDILNLESSSCCISLSGEPRMILDWGGSSRSRASVNGS